MFFNILIISCLLIIKINDFTSAECVRESYDIRNLPSETSPLPPPAQLKPIQSDSEIKLFVLDQHEYFDLVLFANPFIKDRPDDGCPPLNTTDYNLRRYDMECHLSTDGEVNNETFSSIFTGCHYFIMINRERQRWDFSFFFNETSYTYLDTRVTYKNSWTPKPESRHSGMQLEFIFEIPLDCISVLVEFYERPHNANDLREIERAKIPKDQLCTIRIEGGNGSVQCTLEGNITAAVSIEDHEEGDKWIVHSTWANLTHGGGHYYLVYENIESEKCDEKYGVDKMDYWKLIKHQTHVDLGEQYVADVLPNSPSPSKGSHWLWIVGGLVGFFSIILLLYWIRMWRRLPGTFCKKNESHGIPILLSGPTRMICQSESTDILLIYEKGSPSVEELEDFKLRLEQKCRSYKIRDVYAPSEWTNLEKVNSVQKWVEQQLKAESIVIWFDTPQLRSRFNDQEQYQTRDDFRDMAATHAFSWVKARFLNPTTQYCRHFVVRLKGFEIDDRQDDPLQLVSPYARYLLPEQFADLCNHLNSSTELLKNDKDFCREIKSESQLNSGTAQPNIRELA